MKALVYTGPKAMAYRDVPDPSPGEGEVLVRIDSVGICGSDMHAYLGHDERRPAPLILGHEVSGTVLEDGRRVTINPLVTCLTCDICPPGQENLCAKRQIISMPPREGGFAEAIAMPERNLVTVPDGISADRAALTEPLSCAWHAVRLARETRPTAKAPALVIGGGAIGLGSALALVAQGIEDVTLLEPNPLRRTYLQERCGQTVITPDDLQQGQQFDIIVDAVGIEPTRQTASAHTSPGGVIAHIGLGSASGGLDIRRLTLQEIAFIGTYAFTMADFRATAAAIFSGAMGPLDWAETRPLSSGGAAFSALLDGDVAAPKIILKPQT